LKPRQFFDGAFYFILFLLFLTMKSKKEIRERIKKKREKLSKEEVKERSSLIFSNLLIVPAFFRSEVVHLYISSKNNEVDTHNIIRWLLKEKKRVVVPVVDVETKTMRHSEIFSLSELAVNPYGIYEPKLEQPVKTSELDCIIIPALAVDRKGNRVGFGGGFYDRFLQNVQLPTIALAYEFQLLEELPVEEFDVKISAIVTENQIIKCSG
jgi:5-formyltetrahydrofolate cyclo-ligase